MYIFKMIKIKIPNVPLGWLKTRHILYLGLSGNIWSSKPITVNEKLKIYGENGENQSQMNSNVTKKCFKSQRPEVIKGFDCSK